MLFNGWVLFHCIYVPHLPYPLLCWWTFRLLPFLSYKIWCFDTGMHYAMMTTMDLINTFTTSHNYHVCVCVCIWEQLRSTLLLNSKYVIQCVCSQWLSCVQLFVTPWTVTSQDPLYKEFSRQEYWSGLPFTTLGDLPNPGIKPACLASPELAGGFFTTVSPGKPYTMQQC